MDSSRRHIDECLHTRKLDWAQIDGRDPSAGLRAGNPWLHSLFLRLVALGEELILALLGLSQ